MVSEKIIGHWERMRSNPLDNVEDPGIQLISGGLLRRAKALLAMT